nr:unnamed protein product [Leishmania braziliensis]
MSAGSMRHRRGNAEGGERSASLCGASSQSRPWDVCKRLGQVVLDAFLSPWTETPPVRHPPTAKSTRALLYYLGKPLLHVIAATAFFSRFALLCHAQWRYAVMCIAARHSSHKLRPLCGAQHSFSDSPSAAPRWCRTRAHSYRTGARNCAEVSQDDLADSGTGTSIAITTTPGAVDSGGDGHLCLSFVHSLSRVTAAAVTLPGMHEKLISSRPRTMGGFREPWQRWCPASLRRAVAVTLLRAMARR